MVETIIITALVSVISTLAVIYFIWVGVRAHKLNKQVKDNTNEIQNLYKQIENFNNLLAEKEMQLYDNINNVDQELHEKINREISDVGKINEFNVNVDQRFDEVHKNFGDYDQELHRELDKRFDRVYQILKEMVRSSEQTERKSPTGFFNEER